MDVELQILKYLARDAQPTVSFIDEYCAGYKDFIFIPWMQPQRRPSTRSHYG
jgi:hypothetical protein